MPRIECLGAQPLDKGRWVRAAFSPNRKIGKGPLAPASAFNPDALIAYCEGEAAAIISTNRDVLAALADALVTNGALSGDQVNVS